MPSFSLALASLGRFLLDLVLPAACVLCSSSEDDLCAACFDSSTGVPSVEVLGPLRLVTSGADPTHVVPILRRLKDRGQTRLARPLGRWLSSAIAEATAGSGHAAHEVVLVVPPSPWSSWRKRGFHPVSLMLRRAGLVPVPALVNRRRRFDQRKLTAQQRALNLSGAFRARAPLAGLTVLIVDDVVTTGSTILEAQRALEAAGARVLGAVALARVPLWRDTAN